MNNKKCEMYNEDIKRAFISNTVLLSQAQNVEQIERRLESVFIRSNLLETQIHKDIYEMDSSEARGFLSKHLCGGQEYQVATLSTFKSYVDWALQQKISTFGYNVFADIKTTEIDVSDSYADTMVKDENDLVNCLNTILLDISEETADNARWCIFLLIFSGVPFKEVFYLKKDDLDLNNRVLRYGSQTIRVSDNLCEVLHNYLNMDELQKNGKNDSEYSAKICDEGYLISNTKNYGTDRDKMRLSYTSDISTVMSNCAKKLKPATILDSGIFYRMYLNEQQTGVINCLEYLRSRKHLSLVIDNSVRAKKICEYEYKTWKKAFGL